MLGIVLGFTDGSVIKNPLANARRCGFNPCIRKVPWRRKWQYTPVYLPGKSHGQKSWRATIYGVTKSQTQLGNSTTTIGIVLSALFL